jgi:hypothetical protein
MVFLIGPNAGSSQDDLHTERANAYRLFRSLADRQRVCSQILWVFWIDGFPNQRQRLLHEVAEFLLLLIARPEGEELRRSLLQRVRHRPTPLRRLQSAVLTSFDSVHLPTNFGGGWLCRFCFQRFRI